MAGVDIPVFEGADFAVAEYDFFTAPLWVDAAVERMKKILLVDLEDDVWPGRPAGLRPSCGRRPSGVNLFEKVKIPRNAGEYPDHPGSPSATSRSPKVVRGKIAQRKVIARTAA